MSVAITINPDEIQQISQPRTVNSSRLRVLARKTEALAIAVENKWQYFSPKEQELLESLIYSSIAHPEGKNNTFISSFLTRLSLAWILIKGETDSLTKYLQALSRLKNAVLDAIERENPTYNQVMTEVVKEALDESEESPLMTSDEFKEWLNRVSD